jgi:hypothetical protein
MKFATLNDALIERGQAFAAFITSKANTTDRSVRFADLHSRALGLLHHFQAAWRDARQRNDPAAGQQRAIRRRFLGVRAR